RRAGLGVLGLDEGERERGVEPARTHGAGRMADAQQVPEDLSDARRVDVRRELRADEAALDLGVVAEARDHLLTDVAALGEGDRGEEARLERIDIVGELT